MTILDIRPEADHQKLKETININYLKDEDTFKGKFQHYKKSGELIDVEIYSGPITLGDKTYRLVIANDVTEKMLFENQITKAIIKTQEDERYEIGSELHDNVYQILIAAQMTLGNLKNSLPPSNDKYLNQCQEYISLASKEIRALSHQLAPVFFKDTSVQDAFNMLLTNFNIENRYKIAQNFDSTLNESIISQEIQLNLYRILQEQLRNIAKHSNANSIEVNLQIKDNIKLQISDDGIGFDVNTIKDGIGLANIKRRAELFLGKISIDSSPGNGCKIEVEIPVKNLKEAGNIANITFKK
jgi:signal transduction histidine kinase